jgi:hypothetical protein
VKALTIGQFEVRTGARPIAIREAIRHGILVRLRCQGTSYVGANRLIVKSGAMRADKAQERSAKLSPTLSVVPMKKGGTRCQTSPAHKFGSGTL